MSSGTWQCEKCERNIVYDSNANPVTDHVCDDEYMSEKNARTKLYYMENTNDNKR